MVWFYRSFTFSSAIACTSFQSHYGLILSVACRATEQRIHRAFNPTMVWFYLSIILVQYNHISCFQSHYGLILSSLWTSEIEFEWALSIPLWSDFIAIVEREALTRAYNFQSHYGLILSFHLCNVCVLHVVTFNPTMVWFYRPTGRESSWRGWELSIPLWSDFIS